ncbi:transposase [Candidatus Enterovibrio escicola]|uniref:transposase n=1 Tax=Candidatus Enterovibrio escicola TaxID=1927127 RepID=UPI001237C8B9
MAAEVSLVSVGDNEVLPIFLNPLRRNIQQVSANGAYDTRAGHHVLKNKGITHGIPLRSNPRYWKEGHPRNEAVKIFKRGQTGGEEKGQGLS